MPEGRATRIAAVVAALVVGFWLVGHAKRNWLPGPTLAAEAWVGQEVMPKWGAKLRNAQGVVDDLDLPVPYTVHAVRGDRMEVGVFDRRWIRGVDVVRVDDAFDYYEKLADEGDHSGWALAVAGSFRFPSAGPDPPRESPFPVPAPMHVRRRRG